MQAIESTRLQGGSNADAMTADRGSILCNRPNARVASPNMLQCFHEVLVAGPDAKSQVRTPPMKIRV